MKAHRYDEHYDFVLGKIEATFLGWEDHGLPTFNLTFDLGGSDRQGMGHLLMGHSPRNEPRCYVSSAPIFEITRLLGPWEKLVGKAVRVLFDHPYQYNAPIRGMATLFSDDALILPKIFEPCKHEAH